MKTEVALILDANFGHKLQIIAPQMPVWIVRSQNNTAIVKELRAQSNSYQLTEFYSEQNESNVSMFHRIVFTLDEHHSEVSQDNPYNTLLVYGLDLDYIDKSLLSELNFTGFQKTEYGFKALKHGKCVQGVDSSSKRTTLEGR